MRTSLAKHKALLAVTLLFSVITSAAGVLIALILQKVIDAALQSDWELFRNMLIFTIFYLLLLALFSYVYVLSCKALIRSLTISLRDRVFGGLFRRNAAAFSDTNSADYLSALTNDIKLIEENYIQPLLDTLQNLVIFIASLVILLYLSPLVTVILIGCMALMFVIPSLFGKALQNKQSAVSAQMSQFTIRLKDFLSGYEVITSFGMSKHVRKQFQQENRQAAKVRFDADRLLALNGSISHTLAILTQFSVVFIAAYLIISGRLSAGSLVALVQLSGGFVGPVLVMMQNIPKIKGVKPIVERINNLAADRKESVSNSAGLSPMFTNALEAKHVQFAYEQGQTVLTDVTLSLQKGKKYAVVGPSGSGKSTLIKLLTGYYDTYEGSIKMDGTDIRQLNHDELQQMFSTIHQHVYLFDADIRHNICLYDDFSEEALKAAIEHSGVHKFLPDMKEGLQSPVGENGSLLSGGQRQRIALARGLIRNKEILILDEGTSAIDLQTAYEIETRLLSLQDLTLITITHSMNEHVLSLYDEIIYMEDGRIAEIGTLEELLELGKGFQRFYTLERQEPGSADKRAFASEGEVAI